MQWQILFSLAPKLLWMVTAATELKDTCSLEEKLTNLDSVLKSRNITLPTKAVIIKAMVFPVVMYRCESWTKKKRSERWRIDAFKLWCWKRLLRVPWRAGRSKQSILLRKSTLNIHWKDGCWSWNSNILSYLAKNWLIGKDPDSGKVWG